MFIRVFVCIRLRDLSNHEKGENQRLQKQLDIHRAEATSLGKEKEKLASNLQQLEEEVIELKEQVMDCLGKLSEAWVKSGCFLYPAMVC